MAQSETNAKQRWRQDPSNVAAEAVAEKVAVAMSETVKNASRLHAVVQLLESDSRHVFKLSATKTSTNGRQGRRAFCGVRVGCGCRADAGRVRCGCG